MARRPVLFMHIHKTGGTSLSAALKASFDPAEICPLNTDFLIEAEPPEQLRRYRFFAGHISPAVLEPVVGPLTVVTLLRRPQERLFSAWRFWKAAADRDAPLLPQLAYVIARMSFDEFLSSPLTEACTDNVQAKLLSGWRFGRSNDERICVVPADRAPAARPLAGVIEAWPASAALFSRALGIPLPTELARLNAGDATGTPICDPAQMERRTRLDWAVYRACSEALPAS